MPDLLVRKNYPFVDYIRFFSLAGIVFIHTDVYPQKWDFAAQFHKPVDILSYIALKQLAKFSTICFFMISGYLIADNLKINSPITLIKNRLRSILRPFLLAFAIFLILLLINGVFKNALGKYSKNSFREVLYFMFYSPFWFIPAYLFILSIILIGLKYINTIFFGVILLSITAFYTFSASYMFKSHTTEIPAFIFYVWLGIIVNQYKLVNKILKFNIFILLAALLIAYVLSCYQSYNLFEKKYIYYLGSLHFFNQMYSLLVFCFLVRICPQKPLFWIFKPRYETYGIYLYHFFFVVFALKPFVEYLNIKGWFPSEHKFLVLCLFVLEFIFCYIITTMFVKLIRYLKIPVL